MVIDASALIAILFEEPEAERFLKLIASAPHRRISAANLLEAAIRADRVPDKSLGPALDALVRKLDMRIEPVHPDHVEIARRAYREFGRGNRPAALNYGDCFAYALAKGVDEPLLFKGNDFSRTDVEPC
jgi:ribonuclease VapC